MRFSLDGDEGMDILRSGYPQATPASCPAVAALTDQVEETSTAGGSSLTYDPDTGQ